MRVPERRRYGDCSCGGGAGHGVGVGCRGVDVLCSVRGDGLAVLCCHGIGTGGGVLESGGWHMAKRLSAVLCGAVLGGGDSAQAKSEGQRKAGEQHYAQKEVVKEHEKGSREGTAPAGGKPLRQRQA